MRKWHMQWGLILAVVFAVGCESTPGGSDVSSDASQEEEAVADATELGDTSVDEPWVEIVFPTEGSEVDNPVTFLFEAGGGVVNVMLECEGWPLSDSPIALEPGSHTYDFSGVNTERHALLIGYDEAGDPVATDDVRFTPVQVPCSIADQPGFNHYTVAAINDASRFPKDGTYPYCWEYFGDTCGDMWGQIYDGEYGGEMIFGGGGDCFCSGHTLEIFLWSYRLWLEDMGLPVTTPFEYMGSTLTLDSVDIGDFYQYWQGFGVATYASSADAFETTGIGENIWEDRWDEALPGDYVNLSRSTGSGHAVIFVDWVWEGDVRVGLRYYGCNGSGQSCPDSEDPENTWGNSGPSFITEYFEGHGGSVLPSYLFIGRVYLPVSS